MSTTAYCRLCAELKPVDKQLDSSADSVVLDDTLAKLIRLKVEDLVDLSAKDALPKTICFTCCSLLDRTSEFLENLERAQAVLREVFRVDVKQEKSEDENYDAYPDTYQQPSDDDHDKKPLVLEVKFEDYGSANSDTEFLAEKKRRKLRKKKKRIKTLEHKIKYDAKETWKEYTWKCSICECTAKSIEDFRTHMSGHSVCNAFQCSDCGKKVSTFTNFLVHVKKHRRHLKHCCHICYEMFESSAVLKAHILDHDQRNQCQYCGSSFDDEQSLKDHSDKNKIKKKKLSRELKKEDLTCDRCDKVFKSRANLLVHQLIHTERRRDHTCDKCGKTFFNKGTLGSHMLLHDDTRPYKCEICGAMFKTTTQLRSHVGIHGGPRPYSCEQCGRSFRLRCHLKSHLIIHTDSMPHTCEFCGKAFRFKTILTQHLRQHTGVKPYVCQHCQRDFTNWPNYNKHMKRRHGIDTAKKKHTPEGVFPVNPLTGEVQCLPDLPDAVEWKNKIMNNLRRPGRPKNSQSEGTADTRDIKVPVTNSADYIKVLPIEVPTFPKPENQPVV